MSDDAREQQSTAPATVEQHAAAMSIDERRTAIAALRVAAVEAESFDGGFEVASWLRDRAALIEAAPNPAVAADAQSAGRGFSGLVFPLLFVFLVLAAVVMSVWWVTDGFDPRGIQSILRPLPFVPARGIC